MKRGTRTWMVLVAILLAACGGGTARKPAAVHADAPEESEPAAHSEAAEESISAQPGNAKNCSDGSCFECGKGFCLTGFFCDEGAEGGAACSWLPSCPQKASCECIERVLGAACRCQESGAAVSVSCG